MTEHILSMIGLAKKAGQVAIGEEPVGSAARAKDARVILVAQDAAGSVRRAMSFGQTGACLCLTVPFDKDAAGPCPGPHQLRHGSHNGHRLCRGHRQKAGGPGPGAIRPGGPAAGDQGPPGRPAPGGAGPA